MLSLSWLAKWKDKILKCLFKPVIKEAFRDILTDRDLTNKVDMLASFDSARYILDNMSNARNLINQELLLSWGLGAANIEGMVLEFGVWKGRTIKYIANQVRQQVYGFDTFRGIDQKWTMETHMSHFDLQGKIPEGLPFNVELITGLFADTLPGFLEKHKGPVRFLHIDSDIYESAHTVLEALKERIIAGTVIVFDEYLNYPGWKLHEHRAFKEYIEKYGSNYEYIGYASKGYSVAVRITGRVAQG